jgi:tetratricopeptide (TPR) repeat protein
MRPNFAQTYGLRGMLYHKKGDEDRAIADYNDRLSRETDVGTLLSRGDARRNKKDYEGAGADYSEAIRLAPKNAGGYKGRCFIRLVSQDFKGAIEDCDTAINLEPNEAGLYINRGSALSMLGERRRALADYDTAIALEPGHPINHVSRAMVLNEMGDRVGALASLRKALALVPGFPPALEQLEKIQSKKQTSR